MELISYLDGLSTNLAAFLIAIGLVVFVHEAGHYLAARLSGIEVQVFSIGFGPVILRRVDRRGTEWRLSMLPIGGYVRFAQEGNSPKIKNQQTRPISCLQTHGMAFPDASLLRRSFTVVSGPIANFVASVMIFAALTMALGIPREDVVIGSLKPLPIATWEFNVGDKIVALNGVPTDTYPDYFAAASSIPSEMDPIYFTVERDGRLGEVKGPHPLLPIISSVLPNSSAANAGLRPGDVILSVNKQRLVTFNELANIVKQSGGNVMTLEVWREGQPLTVSLRGQEQDWLAPDGEFQKQFQIGVTGGTFFIPATNSGDIFAALKLGLGQTMGIITGTVSGLIWMVRGDISACNLQGPIGIARVSGDAAEQGLVTFIRLIALLSTAIGFVNLLPIPVLDGGHLAFYLYEAIAKKPPPDALMKFMMTLGIFALILLLIFSTFNDLTC